MAIIHPFKAWRPSPEQVSDISSVPYDVINTEEAKAMADDNPQSFIHVIRPEIDLPNDIDIHDDRVYKKGAENLKMFKDEGFLKQENQQSLYIYKLTKDGETQSGIFACVSVEDYDNDVILKHELTRPEKEDDRTRHIMTQSAHAEPVMMTFKDTEEIHYLMDEITDTMDSLYDFTAPDGVGHQIWQVDITEAFEQAFKKIPHLYIADGHHRCKSASRVAETMKQQNPDHTGREEYNFFPAVLFPMDQMHILPYNRILYDVSDEQWNTLQTEHELTESVHPVPDQKGEIAIYYDGIWHGYSLPLPKEPSSVEKLDVARLQRYLLEPIFGIKDQRNDKNLHFVGGIRGTTELERLVDSQDVDMAISMYPTSIEELVDVSDEGELMPPKSTWFEPKLRSGILVHTF